MANNREIQIRSVGSEDDRDLLHPKDMHGVFQRKKMHGHGRATFHGQLCDQWTKRLASGYCSLPHFVKRGLNTSPKRTEFQPQLHSCL